MHALVISDRLVMTVYRHPYGMRLLLQGWVEVRGSPRLQADLAAGEGLLAVSCCVAVSVRLRDDLLRLQHPSRIVSESPLCAYLIQCTHPLQGPEQFGCDGLIRAAPRESLLDHSMDLCTHSMDGGASAGVLPGSGLSCVQPACAGCAYDGGAGHARQQQAQADSELGHVQKTDDGPWQCLIVAVELLVRALCKVDLTEVTIDERRHTNIKGAALFCSPGRLRQRLRRSVFPLLRESNSVPEELDQAAGLSRTNSLELPADDGLPNDWHALSKSPTKSPDSVTCTPSIKATGNRLPASPPGAFISLAADCDAHLPI